MLNVTPISRSARALLLGSIVASSSLGTLATAAPQTASRAASPELRCDATSARGSVRLCIQGLPGDHVLLALGLESRGSARWPGCRVDPRVVRPVDLGPAGIAEVELERAGQPIFAQAWAAPTRRGDVPKGTWSPLVVVHPATGSEASIASTGDLVITEFLKDPSAVSDAKGEWIELKNLLPWRLDISGVVLSDASGAAFVFENAGAPLYLRPGQSFLVGAEADPGQNGGVQIDWEWTGFSLRNSEDQIYLHDRRGALLDAVEYDDGILWPDTPGRSISLLPELTSAAQNDAPSAWCHSTSPFGSGGDTGTPGQPNDECP
jgi:hypothetical protein